MESECEQGTARVVPLPTFAQQLALVRQHHTETLLFCPDAWALRHRFVNQDTGEVIRARCDKWECLYCGPRKVDRWRQLVKLAEPTLFVTLTKVGWTLEEAARVYTTVLQYVRRGSKGVGRDHLGARPAYPIECFAVLEEHQNFEGVGFHWHLLVKGVEYLPKQVVSDALRSATKGRSYIVDVESVKKIHAVGYVTKYLTKEITAQKRGMREVLQEVIEYGIDEQGYLVEKRSTQTIEVLSRARRIRYTRGFFPASTAELRLRLFAGLAHPDETGSNGEGLPDLERGEEQAENEQAFQRSSWVLYEQEEFSREIEDYRVRYQAALLESLGALREGKPVYSWRVVGIWNYQRKRAQAAFAQSKREAEVRVRKGGKTDEATSA